MLLLILRTLVSSFRSKRFLALENLALRHQLNVLQRNAGKRRLRAADRALWVLLSQLWNGWRGSLTIVQPETVVRWHREGFRLYWRWKSRGRHGRPCVAPEVRDLIRRMSRANPLWGAPRIHGELLKLGVEVSQASVSKYMVRHHKPPSPSWRAFLRNHGKGIVSIDFFTVPTGDFRILFVFLVLGNHRRRILHFNVGEAPSAAWVGQQLIEAFPWDTAPRFLIRDRDGIYGLDFTRRVDAMGIEQIPIAARAPWQNPFVERVIGSIRRECLDHLIVLKEMHLRRLLKEYLAYYHGYRTHLGLEKDCPETRAMEPPALGKLIELPPLGGLHHRYLRQAT